jgi:hypothetical protein
MKATDLIKSLSLSSITSEDFKVVTLYKGQNPDVFLVDNFGDGNVVNAKPFSLEPPTLLGSKDFLAVYNNVPLATPDGKSVFMPDCVYEVEGAGNVSLYSFN